MLDCVIETTEKVLVCELHHIKSMVFFLKEGVREEWVTDKGERRTG